MNVKNQKVMMSNTDDIKITPSTKNKTLTPSFSWNLLSRYPREILEIRFFIIAVVFQSINMIWFQVTPFYFPFPNLVLILPILVQRVVIQMTFPITLSSRTDAPVVRTTTAVIPSPTFVTRKFSTSILGCIASMVIVWSSYSLRLFMFS